VRERRSQARGGFGEGPNLPRPIPPHLPSQGACRCVEGRNANSQALPALFPGEGAPIAQGCGVDHGPSARDLRGSRTPGPRLHPSQHLGEESLAATPSPWVNRDSAKSTLSPHLRAQNRLVAGLKIQNKPSSSTTLTARQILAPALPSPEPPLPQAPGTSPTPILPPNKSWKGVERASALPLLF
jgi:hypothetical protein